MAQQWRLASGSVPQSFLNLPVVRVSRLGVVGVFDRIQMARYQRVHADIRPDQASIDVNGFSRNQPRRLTLLDDLRENPAKDILAPALPDAGQRRMVRQCLMQGIADEPADREIDLGFSHQSPIMDHA
jgi:hypothetical protein